MAVNFKIVAPDYAKLNDSISVSGTLTWHATEAVDYMNLYVTDPKGKTASYSISVYGSHDNAYTSAKKLIMDMPGRWKLEYGWVRYVSDPKYPNGILDTSPVKYVNVIDPNAPKPTIEVSPRLSVIKLNDSPTFRMDVKGAQAHHKLVGLLWDIAGRGYQGESQSITIGPVRELGTYSAKATATFQDGLGGSFVVTDETTFTVTNAIMSDVNIMITTSTPEVEFGSSYAFTSSVTGAPAGATIRYEWIVNGSILGTEASFYETVVDLPMERKVSLVASVISPGYEGITVQSPEISILVKPMSVWTPDVRPNGSYMTNPSWQTGVNVNYGVYNNDHTNVEITSTDVIVSQDGVDSLTGLSIRDPFPIKKVDSTIQTVINGVATGYINGVKVLESVPFTKNIDTLVRKAAGSELASFHVLKVKASIANETFYINGPNKPIINLEGKSGQTLTIPVSIVNEYLYSGGSKEIETVASDRGKANYDELFNSTNSVIEVLDFKGDVVGTVSNSSVDITLPNEAKEIVGKIRLRTPAGLYTTSENIMEVDLKIRVYPNPLTPTPDITMTFDPNPCVLESNYNSIISATSLPANAKIFTKFDDDIDFVETDRKSYQAIAMGGRLHTADVKIVTDEFDDYFYTVQESIDVVGKSWPEVSLGLTPSKTKLTVGEALFIDAVLTAPTEIADDPNSSISVEWYKDDIAIPNEYINRNYDLNWIVKQIGVHTFKCVIVIHNIDYEGGHKLVENSVQITTENRKMAITVSINPASGAIKFGESQKLTAVVEGAPVDATIDYAWKVDGAPVTADAGSNGLSITVQGDKVGTKLASLTVTATAEGSEPATEGATANVVIAKAEQTPFTATLTVTPEVGEVGDTFSAKVDVSGQMAGAAITYKWATGETTPAIEYVADAAGKTTLKCDVTSTLANYVDLKVSRSKTITISDVTPIEVDGFYIWPLPHIDAAFMYGSWWALDEIQAITVEGKDWKTETTFKYQKEIDAFKQILTDYNIVMVQESRNGRIIDRQKLESGLIY